MSEQLTPQAIQSTRQARRAILAKAADPGLSSEGVWQLLATSSNCATRVLLQNPACDGFVLAAFAESDAPYVLRNPAFEALSLFDPGFLPSMTTQALARLARCRHAPAGFLAWCADQARLHYRDSTDLAKIILDHPNATPAIRALLPDTRAKHLYDPSPFKMDRISRESLEWLLETAWTTSTQEDPRESDQLLAAMAMHGLISSSSTLALGAIRATGLEACVTVLIHHPSLNHRCSTILMTAAVDLWVRRLERNARRKRPPFAHSRQSIRAHLEGLQRDGQLAQEFPDLCFKESVSAWDAAETAVLAMRRQTNFLPTFLLLSGQRCPRAYLDRAARRGFWPMRLAAAMNPKLHPTIRADLAANDRNSLVRLLASQPRRAEPGIEPIASDSVIERRLPGSERRRLKKIRRALTSTPRTVTRHCSKPLRASSLPKRMRAFCEEGLKACKAVDQVLRDPLATRLLLAGAHSHGGSPTFLTCSPINRFAPPPRASWIASEVYLKRAGWTPELTHPDAP